MTRLQIEELIEKTEHLYNVGAIQEQDYHTLIDSYNKMLDNLPTPTINTNTEAHKEFGQDLDSGIG